MHCIVQIVPVVYSVNCIIAVQALCCVKSCKLCRAKSCKLKYRHYIIVVQNGLFVQRCKLLTDIQIAVNVSNNIIYDCPLQNKRFKKQLILCIDGHIWFRKMVY
jgi:hypothetical protein